ncbi:ABC transporter substrate-binding protein [Paenibacillus baekrokdamisoli]|uniref:ABC transporter substrate-binding protein n=1 Tax=Paenibacillus baekrokdamisoli TaxID=1712516 RepID=A0A3G9JEX5_9BACL|nr:ABC transporter substrate-binding protein [Paenibacillus baekrokdamisoli]MBB3071091.1 putative aldouronate transport system substrate-binding protein [Paenibacillus baekrokdamisoli]BBH21509.1 ABC transporter substrate-binding protein [Paenibacillus baekrokdamisoli]
MLTNKKKGIQLGLTVLMSMSLILSACGGGSNQTEKGSTSKEGNGNTAASGNTGKETGSKLDPVELTWYYPQWSTQPDTKSVEEAINKITSEKLNVKIKLMPTDGGSYEQKLNTMVAANEDFDIAWTSFWMFNYAQNARRGAFAQIDDLLKKDAPELKKSMPDLVWDALKVDGKTYAILNYQTITNKEGFLIQKRFADKYSLDTSKIKSIKDIEPFLVKIKENEPDIIPFAMTRGGNFENMKTTYNNLEFISNEAIVGIYRGDSTTKVVDVIQTPEYKEYLDLMNSWYKKGLINKDAPTVKALDDRKKAGQLAVTFHNVLKPGREVEEKNASGGQDIIIVPTSEPFVGTNTIIQSMQAISKTSKNPERALMFLNLLNTDKELLNLVCYGIEGKHYTRLTADTIKLTENSGYNPNQTWVFGNGFLADMQEGQNQEVRDLTLKENSEAKSSPILGFTFDPEPVQSEIANIQAVNDEYGPPLNTGAASSDQKLAQYIEQRKKAGIEKVVAEVQKQLDAWKQKTAK